MNEEQDVIVEAETTTDPSSEENEQDSSVSEDVKPQESDGKDYKTIAENLSKALKEEREKNKQPQPTPAPQAQPQVQDDETVKRFLATLSL